MQPKASDIKSISIRNLSSTFPAGMFIYTQPDMRMPTTNKPASVVSSQRSNKNKVPNTAHLLFSKNLKQVVMAEVNSLHSTYLELTSSSQHCDVIYTTETIQSCMNPCWKMEGKSLGPLANASRFSIVLHSKPHNLQYSNVFSQLIDLNSMFFLASEVKSRLMTRFANLI
jgi:hypothetical protein